MTNPKVTSKKTLAKGVWDNRLLGASRPYPHKSNKQEKTSAVDQSLKLVEKVKEIECVGVLQASWLDVRTGLVSSVNYATAFLVSPTLILTCSHNIYSQQIQRQADILRFMLQTTSGDQVFQCKEFNFLPLKEGQSLLNCPTINQICLIRLNRPATSSNFIKLCCDIPLKDDMVRIVGYSRKKYANSACIQNIKAHRVELRGTATSYQDVMMYKIKTRTGFSGSPILMKTTEGLVAVGMHSHPGENGFNQGLYFDQYTLGLIRSYERDFQKNFGVDRSIQYLNLSQDYYYADYGCSDLEYSQEFQESEIDLDQQFYFDLLHEQLSVEYCYLIPKSDEQEAVMRINQSNIVDHLERLPKDGYLINEEKSFGIQ